MLTLRYVYMCDILLRLPSSDKWKRDWRMTSTASKGPVIIYRLFCFDTLDFTPPPHKVHSVTMMPSSNAPEKGPR